MMFSSLFKLLVAFFLAAFLVIFFAPESVISIYINAFHFALALLFTVLAVLGVIVFTFLHVIVALSQKLGLTRVLEVLNIVITSNDILEIQSDFVKSLQQAHVGLMSYIYATATTMGAPFGLQYNYNPFQDVIIDTTGNITSSFIAAPLEVIQNLQKTLDAILDILGGIF